MRIGIIGMENENWCGVISVTSWCVSGEEGLRREKNEWRGK